MNPQAPSPPLSRISPARLFLLLILFAAACGYAILHSDRFERAGRALVVRMASAALERDVSFGDLSFSIVPPALTVTNVRVAGASTKAPPFFETQEISVSGSIALVGRTLSLGTISFLRPVLRVHVFPNGTDNLPPGLKRKSGHSPLRVKIGRLGIQGGVLEFNAEKIPLNIDLRSVVAEVTALGIRRTRFRGRIGCPAVRLTFAPGVPLTFALKGEFDLSGTRLHVDTLALDGAAGHVRISGEIPDLARPRVSAWVTGQVDTGQMERALGSSIPFQGNARLAASIRAGVAKPFRILGHVEFAHLRSGVFDFQNVAAAVNISPAGVMAQIERGTFDNGQTTGVFRIGRLDERPENFELLLAGQGISVERFLGTLRLPHTRLATLANLDLALRWGGAGVEKADGGGWLSLGTLPPASGRDVPVSGGGPAVIQRGFINFENAVFRFPRQTDLTVNGGFAIGDWNPRMSVRVDSQDLRVADRLLQNFSEAINGRPANPLGLAGSATLTGRLSGTWAVPQLAGQLSAQDASYSGLRLGTVYWDLSIADRAFNFQPLRSYDGDASLSLSGYTRYAPKKGTPLLDLTVQASKFPVERIVKFLDLDIPVTGRVTGTVPFSGDAAHLQGGGAVVLTEASFYGQPASRVGATIVLSPGRVAFQNVRGSLAGAVFGGNGSWTMSSEGSAGSAGYQFELAADAVPLAAISALSGISDTVSGEVSFRARGAGSFAHPQIEMTAETSDMAVNGRLVAAPPRLSATLDDGVLHFSAGPERGWSVRADGPVSGGHPRLNFSTSFPDLSVITALFPKLAPGFGGLFEASGAVDLDAGSLHPESVNARISRLRVAFPGVTQPVETALPVDVRYASGQLSISGAQFSGPGTQFNASLAVDTRKENALSGTISGTVSPVFLDPFLPPGTDLVGRIAAKLSLAGTLANPGLDGTVTVMGGRFKSPVSPYVVENIDAQLRFSGEQLVLDSFRGTLGGGEVDISGDARLSGYSISEYRFLVQAQNIAVRSLTDLQLRTNADLTILGNSSHGTVRGELTLLSGTYTRDFAPTLASLFAQSRSETYAAPHTWEDDVTLEVQIVSAADLEVRNSLAQLTASVDLLARGTLANPVLLGQISLDEGGRVTFQDVKYEIASGTITFGNPQKTEPVVDLSATAEVKGYSISVQLVGTLSRLQPAFTSDPPLSNDQVVALLLTGSAPGSTPGTVRDQNATASSVAGSIAGLAFRPVTSRVQELFRLDKFEIDPILQGSPGSSGGAVITAGKNLSKNLSVTYSYSAETNAQSILLVEYQLDPNRVIQLSKDENSVYSLDIKFRKRF